MPTGITINPGVTELAKQLGVSHAHLSRVLRGERGPGAGLRARLADLGLEFDRRGNVRRSSARRMPWLKSS